MGWTTGVLCVTAVALTACAHDADGALPEAPAEPRPGDRLHDEYVDAQVQNLEDVVLVGVGEDTARCMAGAIVDVATVDALQDAGVTPDDLATMTSLAGLGVELPGGPSSAVDDLSTAFGPCDFGTELEPPLVGTLGEAIGADLSDGDAACVVDRLDDDGFEEAVAETVVEGSERMAEQIMDAVGRCPGALAEVAAAFMTGGEVDVPADAMACLEEELTVEPAVAEVLWEGGPLVAEALADLAATCGIDSTPGLDAGSAATGDTGDTGDTSDDDQPAQPGEVGGGWDPDLGFDTGGPTGEVDGRTAPDPAPPPAGTLPGAVEVTTLVAGEGPRAQRGDTLVVHYVGVLPDGQVLDSSWELGEPLAVSRLGDGMLIRGWEEGLVGAQAGERRRLVIGADMAYGAAGRPGVPPDSALAFEIDVLEVTPA